MANAATAYALVFFHRGIPEREAVLAFGYNRLAGIVSAGLRLISMGQQQGQALLTRGIERLPLRVDRILANGGRTASFIQSAAGHSTNESPVRLQPAVQVLICDVL